MNAVQHQAYAKVIEDSISPDGIRLTTIELRTWRFVLAEFNTHRTFGRNSASSRAIPFARQLERMDELGPAYPISWPKEQKGMSGGDEFNDDMVRQMHTAWDMQARQAVDMAKALAGAGLHKSVVNRLLEPFMWHTIVVTATAWENFFVQRCSPLAQPEIRVTAELMQDAMRGSEPKPLEFGEWHLPYFETEDYEAINSMHGVDETWPRRISAARCARTSYLTQDGRRDPDADLTLYDRLVSADPPHWSPLEHVATPWAANTQVPLHSVSWEDLETDTLHFVPTDHLPRVGNLLGWRSLRTEEESRKGLVTFR